MVVGAIRSKIGMQRVPSNARSTPLHFIGIQMFNLVVEPLWRKYVK